VHYHTFIKQLKHSLHVFILSATMITFILLTIVYITYVINI